MGERSKAKWELLRQIFAVSAIVQGTAWFVLSLICIVVHYMSEPNYLTYQIHQQTPYNELLTFCLYHNLLNRNSRENNRLLIPRNFHICIWIYDFLSIIWMGLAIAECVTIFRRRALKHSNHILLSLGIATLMVCILDATVFALALVDYLQINPFDYSLTECDDTEEECDFPALVDTQFRYKIGRKIIYGILMTLLARGYVLWVFNCVAGVCSIVASIRRFQMPPILQYDDSIPRPKIQRKPQATSDSGRSSIYENDGFWDEPPRARNPTWGNQEPPQPKDYHTQRTEQPRFVNAKPKNHGF